MDTFEKITGLLGIALLPIRLVLSVAEKIMFAMILLYDSYCYTPLQMALSPMVAMVPRAVRFGDMHLTVFTANIVSWSRTLLVIPIAVCLKYGYGGTACFCILLHDFLDHVDGIVAKTQRRLYGQLDDPLLGGFMDAFCDKIVICLSLWTVLLVTDFSLMTSFQTIVFVGLCSVIIAYEFVLGVVRVQDYFAAYYQRAHEGAPAYTQSIAASMEGKLKEKLESVAVAGLCLCQSAGNPIQAASGMAGLTCLALSVRLAHASLVHKLKARQAAADEYETQTETTNAAATQTDDMKCPDCLKRRASVFYDELSEDEETDEEKSDMSEKEEIAIEALQPTPDQLREAIGGRKRTLSRSMSAVSHFPSGKVDKVYSVGCFDLFHEGHEILLKKLKQIGTQVIVGVHDSRSIFKLKKKVPIDSTSRRMANVKRFADIVFCVHGTDPSPYIQCIFDSTEGLSSMYVRGDDMQNFPSRDLTERLMPIHFLPYTPSVSSTKLRKEIWNASRFGPHLHHDDHTMFY